MINKYVEDFKKILELMSKTMDKYCTEFLEAKGLPNPLSEENTKLFLEKISSCKSDQEYVDILNGYLQCFHQGHLYLNQEKENSFEVFPLIVRYIDGKYIVGASNQESLEGQQITAINGIPIQEYVENHTFANGDRAFAFDINGNLYSPKFQINDDTCTLTMQDGTEQIINKMPREHAIELMMKKRKNIENNVICGRLEGSNIPYIIIQSFSQNEEGKKRDIQVIEDFAIKLNEEGQTDLIIDIRGNGGGSDEYFEYLGAFADKEYNQEHE